MAAINPTSRLLEGDHHGEPHPNKPSHLWCAGCATWCHRAIWRRHTCTTR